MKLKKSYIKIFLVLAFLLIIFFVIKPDKTMTGSTIDSNKKIVLLETTLGNIKIELDSNMPITSGNFEDLVSKGFYDGIIFHRIIGDFMIQGGDPSGDGTGGSGKTIQDEFLESNANNRGTISMANSGPNTGSSQFFINLKDNNFLDSRHPAFGKIIEGMDVIDNIAQVETDARDKPLEDVIIIKATII